LLLAWLPACSNSRPFRLQNLAKSDIDLVADAHQDEVLSHLRVLMVKLYKRNPRELQKAPGHTINSRLHQVFNLLSPLSFAELDHQQRTAAMNLCFDPEFTGDRVLALVTGLAGMLRNSYENRPEQFLLDSLDEQKLYNSARNIEIVVWRLNNTRDGNGELLLLTNSRENEEANLSFERLFGKIIALQDMMARITADRGNRTINLFVHSVASAAFLPVGL
jgi:hypothetical protein